MSFLPGLYPGAATIALIMGTHGYRKGSLSTSGAIAAFLVGYGHLANPLKLFGATMLFFYIVGSRATKVKAEVKAKLEDGVDVSKSGGDRDAIQVLSNSLPSLLAALAFRFSDSTKGIDLGTQSVLSPGLSRALIFASLGHLSNCLADTLASELGILSPTPPLYLPTLQPCKPGTNGAVSPLGLLVSLLGGIAVGGFMALDLWLENGVALSRVPFRLIGSSMPWWVELLVFGGLTGLGGSLLDSILGAFCQQTLYSTKSGKILTDKSTTAARSAPDVGRVGLGRDWLSNSGVNFICGFAMAGVGWWWGSR